MNLNSPELTAGSATHHATREDAALREALKHCSRGTYYAAYQFRLTGERGRLPTLISGIVERYVDPSLRGRLKCLDGGLRFGEDLGIDSLDLIEIVGTLEDVLQIPISDGERHVLRTLADLQRCVECILSAQ